MSEKSKVDKPSKSRINRYGFLAMWVGAQILGWFVFYFFDESLYSSNNAFWLNGLYFGLSIGIPTIIGQKLSLYLHFGRWFRGWIRTNTIAWVVGGLGIMFMTSRFGLSGNRQLDILIQILSLMLPPTLAQLWILRRHVQKIWLWLLAAIAGTSVFAAVFGQLGASNNSAFPAFGLYSLVTGLSLLWLMGMQGEIGKQKLSNGAENFSRLENASDEIAQEDRLPTLQDSVKSAESN
jgi:hypothetical protein